MGRVVNGPLHFSFGAAASLDPEARTARLGGKGAALVRMTAMGLPVPPGFVLTTDACNRVVADGWFAELDDALTQGIEELEATTGRRLGGGTDPLLVSVRSGAPVSMPGMMDTVLNVGMTDEVAVGLGAATGNEHFGWDTARRFVQSYASIVLEAPDDLIAALSRDCLGADEGHDLDAVAMADAAQELRHRLAQEGFSIPTDPARQVTDGVAAVFASWQTDRARTYREVEGISADLGTAATIQMMTFGNMGERSGTGVAFSRDPSTGAPGLVGDLLVGAQGEDVVAGTHQTLPVRELRSLWPDIAAELEDVARSLEHDLTDLVDIEFTVEDGVLWLLQVRRGKRSPQAALRIAIDLADDPAFPVDRAQALERVADVLADPPTRTDPSASPHGPDDVLATGLAASPGRVVGRLITDVDGAVAAGARGESVILVRRETSPADIAGMAEARGLVTARGGLVSHAAVIARSWGVPAVVGASELQVRPDGVLVGDHFHPAGEILTVDGDTGLVLVGDHPSEEIEVDEVAVLRRWQRDLEPATAASRLVDRAPFREPQHREPATDRSCSRVLALKGAASAATVAEALGCDTEAVNEVIAALVAADRAQELPGERYRLLPSAIEEVDARFATEADRLRPSIEPLLDAFHAANDALKAVITAWQIREADGDQAPNDHTDPEYDAEVIDRLDREVHTAIGPILDMVAEAEPRFARYTDRLERALAASRDGDTEMVANPLRDSYHTVWFELHEELIRLSGRTRADEAAAGRA